ncbi:substrate-binding domain-containing protein [Bariatricus massiliensis]|uniref:Substrate-binding domain-containing protein n=1 Tax=Bariatricus massiliensis TaxID=1745713 RepID=A0ABS8DKS1_9FIRM|nr:substrate-binding domain-containing protein [Bariatricus massiliensis]MCB7305905.1 substrate-binding domain-containing protein [Bariatricus massiliensis]MCB7376505.1 substrate-binding domain-containing protein [Bariatricus massiliensis]MCB7389048.1 substrate-binding domain-containing protein [Bariatricus massiliensis]MCB7413221.1 substrate-binding domain-containing protein [Bariatricus massiliensis]MCQ5255117.1 substrate-binding domain-containing protein [Bariatricus massiliensis]
MKKKLMAVLLCAMMVVGLTAGCGDKKEETKPEKKETTSSGKEKLQKDGSPAKEDLHFGMILPSLGHEFWNNCLTLSEQVADQLGVKITTYNCEDSSDKCAEYIETACNSGIDGLIFVAYFDMGPKCLETAKAADIPVIVIDAYIPEIAPGEQGYDNYLAFIGPSDEESGYQMACALFDGMEANADGEKVVGVVNGTAGSTVAVDRRAGFEKAYKEYTGKGEKITIAGEVTGDFVRDKSQEVTESLLQGNPDIKGIWAANGGTGTGVLAAVQSLGYVPGEDIKIVCMDLNEENVMSVKDGKMLFDVGGHWLQGAFAVTMMYDYLNGFDLPADRNVKLTPIPVFQDDVDDFLSVFVDFLPPYDAEEYSRTYNPDASPEPPAITY